MTPLDDLEECLNARLDHRPRREWLALPTAGTPFVIDGHKPPLSPTWPNLGEHNESVLREWLGEG